MKLFSQMFSQHVSTAWILSFLLIPMSAMAGPTLSVQGRIITPSGSVLESSSVQFKIRIVSPDANSCVLYEETQTKDLTGSGGLFSLSLNDGSGVRSDGLGHAFEKTFSNQSAFSVPSGQCASGSGTVTYTPAAGDERKVYIFFRESNALPWEQMPVLNLAHASYALEATESSKVGGFAAANMCRVVDGSNNPVSVSALTSAQFTELLNVAQGNYTKTNANGASVIPSVAGNPGSGLAVGQMWYDTSSNQLKYYDGSVKSVGSGGGGGVSSVVSGTGLLGGSITSTGTLSVDVGTTAGKIVQMQTGDKLPAVDGSALTNLNAAQISVGTLSVSRGGTGSGAALSNNKVMVSSGGAIVEGYGFSPSYTANSFVVRDASGDFAAGAGTFYSTILKGATSGSLTMTVPATVASYNLRWPAAVGSAGNVLTTDASGNLSWVAPSAAGDTSYATKGVVQFNTDAATSGISLSSGVATVNFGTGANQIVKLDGSSKLPAVDGSALTNLNANNISSGSLGIARGGTGATTKTAAFDALSPNTTKGDLIVSDGSNNIRLARGSDGQVLTTDSAQTAGVKWATVNTGTVSSVTAGAGLNGGTITNSGTLAVDVGTGANQIVQLTAASKLPAIDASLLTNLSLSQISSGTLGVSQGGTGASSFAANNLVGTNGTGSGLQAVTCSQNQLVSFNASGSYGCYNLATLAGGTYFANGGNSFATSASLGTNDNYSLSFQTNSSTRMTIDTSGNVGIGKSNPGAPLDVKGEIRLSGATSGYAGLKSPAVGPSVSWTLPSVDGSVGQFLKTDGSGNLSWATGSTVSDGSYSTKGIFQADTDAGTSGLAFNGSGVLKVNAGTGANQIVKLDGSSRLPAVDGSQLTGLNANNLSVGTLSIARGGTNSTAALNNNRIMVSSGGAIVEAAAMSNGQLLIGSSSAAPVVASLGASNGISITTGAGSLSIATNATNANTASAIVSRDASGDFAAHDLTVNNVTASGTLTVTGDVTAGAMRAGKQVSASSYSGSSDAINWNNGNIQTTSSNCQALSFTNMQDGGSYTLVVTDTATTGCAFPATVNGGTAVSWRGQPTLVAHTRTASSHTIYTMMRVGSNIYVSWITGF